MADDASLPFGPISTFAIVRDVANGTATPRDARRLIEEFVRQANTGNVDALLLEHVRDCFAVFLQGKSMEEAFGTARGRGQPPVDYEERAFIAMKVLEARLAGRSLEEAIGEVADARKDAGLPVHGDTEVRNTWKKHRVWGLFWLAWLRRRNASRWSDDELVVLRKIFRGVQNFDPFPEKSANTPP